VSLRAKTKTDAKLIEDLSKERAVLGQKVRDRDEELKGKAKFIVVWVPSVHAGGRLLIVCRIRRMRLRCLTYSWIPLRRRCRSSRRIINT
jgi:hypothetical protein